MPGNVTIIGLGLIGASIGLGLKQAKTSGMKIVGHDREPVSAKEAQKRGAVDSVEFSLPQAVRQADLVVIATPILAIKDVMQTIAPHLPHGCVVTDTGSTKTEVLKWARELLPAHGSFVGGHPMAGKEGSGPAAADAALFKGATYCVIPSVGARADAVQAVVALVELLGAKPFFIDPHEHDSFVAAVSHLPIILSSALVAATTRSPAWHEMARLAASGYRDVTRLASGDPQMNRDICVTNAGEIGPWVDRVIAELVEIRRHLGNGAVDEEAVARHFAHVYEEREKWVAGVSLEPPGKADVRLPTATEQMSSLLMGELLTKKSRDLMKQYTREDEDKPKRR